MRHSSFEIDILSRTGVVMKLTKNLVITASSLWARYTIKKKLYANVSIAHWPPIPPCSHTFAFRWTPLPLIANVIIEYPVDSFYETLRQSHYTNAKWLATLKSVQSPVFFRVRSEKVCNDSQVKMTRLRRSNH